MLTETKSTNHARLRKQLIFRENHLRDDLDQAPQRCEFAENPSQLCINRSTNESILCYDSLQ